MIRVLNDLLLAVLIIGLVVAVAGVL